MIPWKTSPHRHWILFAVIAIFVIAVSSVFFGDALQGSLTDDRVMALADKDASQTLSVREMRTVLVSAIQAMFGNDARYDLDANDKIERNDLTLLIQSIRGFLAAVCGNGKVEATERCDDGNTASGDGCSNLCRNERSNYGDINSRSGWGEVTESHEGHCEYTRDLGNGQTMITDVHYLDPAHPC